MTAIARLATVIAALALLSGATPLATLTIAVDNLRSDRGQLLLCLTADRDHFPDCEGDAAARHLVVPIDGAAQIVIGGVAPGGYAVSVIHDENGNGRLDKRLMIPREGFGFSRNPAIRFGPPKFGEARFDLSAGANRQAIRMKYML